MIPLELSRTKIRPDPRYYFLIDRDHYSDNFVETCWQNFPDPGTGNLLVWRRREIENYFLDPPFLLESVHCVSSEPDLTNALIVAAQERLFLDVANLVISSVREEQKSTWIEQFSNPSDFSSKDEAIQRLTSAREFPDRRRSVSSMVTKRELKERFETELEAMTGGREELTYGTGKWVEMIRGKKILSRLLNSRRFEVRNAEGQDVTGRDKTHEVLKELAVKDVANRPADLGELQRLIESRVTGIQ